MTATKANLSYRPDIDGLRAVAVLAVVLNHLSNSLVPGGYVGVDVFFVISGYLITSIISREIKQGTFSFARFYERRARRIFPALFAVLVVTLVAGYFLLLPSDYAATLRGALGTVFFVSNIVFWRDMAAGYFAATDAGLNPLLHTWSLAVEEQFYVFFPVLLLFCFRYFRRHVVLILLAGVLISLAGAALLVQSKSVAVFFLSPFRGWELLVGSILTLGRIPPIHSRFLREIVAGGGLLSILVACAMYDNNTIFPGLTALAPVLGAAALIYAGGSGPSMARHLLQWRPMIFIGLISYSLYLWHWPLIVLTGYATGMEPITPYVPALFVASLILGSLSYWFVEQPFRRSTLMSRRRIFVTSALFASVLTVVATIGLVRGGFESRFSPEVVELDKARAPEIPYVSCDSRPVEESCVLGKVLGKPSVLLWGDSHLLAWAPAFNEVFSKMGVTAVFAPLWSCPPLLGVDNAVKANCRSQNLAVKSYLLAKPEIKTIIMAANWSAYFREDGPLSVQVGNVNAKGVAVAKKALGETINWLREDGRQVVLVGPVPVYEKSVPLALALERATHRKLLYSSLLEQYKKHASFFELIDGIKQEGGGFSFLDPIQWLCAESCKVIKDGIPLYRDSHHLSIAGVMALESDLLNGLYPAGNVLHSQADIGKAQRLLGYAAEYENTAGIDKSMPWYIDFLK